jgi:hypothetical protein
MTADCASGSNRLASHQKRKGGRRLDEFRTKSEHRGMDDRDRLAFYPFVVVRIACRVCSRTGSYRLARLAAKFGPEITLRDLTDRFSYDCLWRAEARSKAGKSACGATCQTSKIHVPLTCRQVSLKLRLIKSA